MSGFGLVLFCIAVGVTASGLAASLYRLLGFGTATRAGQIWRMIFLVVAGPNLLFGAALRGVRAKTWKPMGFWLATTAIGYWCLVLGLFVLDVALRL